jgi:MFS family permease
MHRGFFIANVPAYGSEVAPLALRGAATAYVMVRWSLGHMIWNGVTYVMNQRADQWAYRLSFAMQGLFTIPLLILVLSPPSCLGGSSVMGDTTRRSREAVWGGGMKADGDSIICSLYAAQNCAGNSLPNRLD